jgi:hypothetical protein
MIPHKATVYRSDNYLSFPDKPYLLSAVSEVLPYRYIADKSVGDPRVGVFQNTETPIPLQSPYVQMLIGLVALQPALKVLHYITGTGDCPFQMINLRIAFNAPAAHGVCSWICQTWCEAPKLCTPIVLTHVDIGFAILVSHILRELSDDSKLNTTAHLISLFVECHKSNLSISDHVVLCCIIHRVLYELGRFGGFCGGSSLAGFPWCFNRGSRVVRELKAIESKILFTARLSCSSDRQREFLSKSLDDVWSRPLLNDMLFVEDMNELMPANSERIHGDYTDTVSNPDVDRMLHLRGMERQTPTAAHTMNPGRPINQQHSLSSAASHLLTS